MTKNNIFPIMIFVIFFLFLIPTTVFASDIQTWQGQYTVGSTFQNNTFVFNFTVYDALTGGTACYWNTTSLNTNFHGWWKTEQYGVATNCSDASKNYYVNIQIDGTNQPPRRLLSQIRYADRSDTDVDFIENVTATYFLGDASQLTNVIMNWSSLIDADLIPETNNATDIGNSTNRFKNIFTSGNLTLDTWERASGMGDMKDSPRIKLTGRWNLFGENDHTLTMYNDVYATTTPYGRLALESYSGAVGYFEPWANSMVIYGGDTTDDRIWLRGSTVDTYPQIGAVGGGAIYLLVDVGEQIFMRENGTIFYTFDRSATTFETDATTGTGYEISAPDLTTGTIFQVTADSQDITTGKIFNIRKNGTDVFYVDANDTNVKGNLKLDGENHIDFNSTGTDTKSLLYNDTLGWTFMRDDNVAAMVFSQAGTDLASYHPRSFMIGGASTTNIGLLASDMNNCTAQGYNHIDCATGTTGADLGIQDELEVRSNTYIGDAENYTKISGDGMITLYGTARATRNIYIPAVNMRGANATYNNTPTNTSGDELFIDRFITRTFDKDFGESTIFNIGLPSDYDDGTNITIKLHWAAGLTVGDAVWVAGLHATGDNEQYTTNPSYKQITETVPGTSGLRKTSTFPEFDGTSIEANDDLDMIVYRDANNSADTYNYDAVLMGIEIEYTANKIGG